MSAPDTNIEKQAKNHRGPLTGILVCGVFVALLLVGWNALGTDEEEAAPATTQQSGG